MNSTLYDITLAAAIIGSAYPFAALAYTFLRSRWKRGRVWVTYALPDGSRCTDAVDTRNRQSVRLFLRRAAARQRAAENRAALVAPDGTEV